MLIASAPIGAEGGHIAGRKLLEAMYLQHFGLNVPEIATEPRGKPYFVNSPVHFSISHTKRRVFCALSDRPIGIDAEEADRQINLQLAEKILSPAEYGRYLQADDRRTALLRLWVLKEAAAKQTGKGLCGYPNQTDFSPDDPRIQMIDCCIVAVVEA